MAKLIRNTGNVFDGFGFGGVSVPERETFYDKSMNRLNSLVERDSTLQRLRDVSCQLMLANRQQEELINYVSSFIYNFDLTSVQLYSDRPEDTTPVWGGWTDRQTSGVGVQPFIKDVFPCQGVVGTMQAGATHEYTSPVNELRLFPYIDRFGGNPATIPDNVFWFGFLSDVEAWGNCGFGDSVTDATSFPYSAKLKPRTDLGLFKGLGFGASFSKVTDTSPYVSHNGIVKFSLMENEQISSLSVRSGFGGRLKVDPAFRMNLLYVGMGVIFG